MAQLTLIAPNVIPARAGDRLMLDKDPFVLWSSCGGVCPQLACVTHSVHLANQGQLEMHIDDGEPHVIAAWCKVHGWEALGV